MALIAALPGILVMAASVAGWAPTARDLPTYFAPLRYHNAEVLAGRESPFWNPLIGCGEPYFANPQTGLLYPPAWSATLLPPGRAVGLEVGLHLALLGAGCCVLARRIGASRWLAVAAGIACVCAGPIVSSAGVLNNLATTAWLPWLWSAALAGSVPGVAIAGAAAWLAAEPQLTVLGGLVALVVAPTRRTLTGLAIAAGLVAVQLLPFSFWVVGGNRGPGSESIGTAVSSATPADLASLLLPGIGAAQAGDVPFVANLALPLWGVLLALAAACERGTTRSRLARVGWALVLVGLIPSVPLAERLWTVGTLGLVRYPSRLLFPAVVALVSAAAACQRRLPLRWAAGLCASLGVIAVALDAGPMETFFGAAGAAAVIGSAAPAAGALAGAAILAPAGIAGLSFRAVAEPRLAACVAQQRPPGRVYVVEPTKAQALWAAADWPGRAYDLGWGYTPLLDGRRMVRSFAPLEPRALSVHVAQADRGPEGRWWLDSLGATVIVSQHRIEGFPSRCSERGLEVLENRGAWPEVFVAQSLPEPDRAPAYHGEVLSAVDRGDAAEWTVEVGPEGGVLVRLATPDPGWRFRVDGIPVSPDSGPGIVHGVPLARGRHVVSASYRPPGLVMGAGVTVLGLGVLVGVRWRRW